MAENNFGRISILWTCVGFIFLVLACNDEQIDGEIFNAGYENHTVNELANMVRQSVGTHVEIEKHSTDDNRSYHVSSEKIRQQLGFNPEKTIQDAIDDLVLHFESGDLPDSLSAPHYFNIKMMQELRRN